MKNVAVLLSGRGSNFLALSDAVEAGQVAARIVLVLSNRPEAPGLQHARERNYETACVPSKGVPREEYDRQVVSELKAAGTDIICLAGFMRLLSAWFVQQFPHRILNIHPCSSFMETNSTSGRFLTSPCPPSSPGRKGSLEKVLEPPSMMACPGTEVLTTVQSTAAAQCSSLQEPHSIVLRSLKM